MTAPSGISSNLLIVEDDEGLRRQYRWMFPDLKLSLAGTRQEAIAAVHREAISVAVVDLGLPPSPDDPTEGLATLGAIRETSPGTKVIIATGQGAREHALKSIELGAYDFFEKPVDPELLRLVVGRALRLFDLESELRRLAEAQSTSPVEAVIGSSREISALRRTIEKVAPLDVAVLLAAESGAGNEMVTPTSNARRL